MATPQHSLPPPPPRTPVRKPSMRDPCATTTPLGGRAKTSEFSARAAPVSLSPPKSAKASPSRGLTLQIADNMAQYSKSKSIQSAPVRETRRLPAPPLPPPPITSIQEVPSTTFPSPTANSASPPRAKRPLPKPPVTVNVDSEKTQSVAPTPTQHQKTARPLPIPIPKAENSSPSRPSPKLTSRSLPSPTPLSQPIPPPIPSPSVIASFSRVDAPKNRHHHSASTKIPKTTASAPRKLHTSRSLADMHVDVVQLHRQLVLNRAPARLSLDSDNTSDDEYSEETFSAAMLIRDGPSPHKGISGAHEAEEDKGNHADYAWLLSNRILYHQKSPEVRLMSKWTREKNGKRYTEEDFSNIISALRSL